MCHTRSSVFTLAEAFPKGLHRHMGACGSLSWAEAWAFCHGLNLGLWLAEPTTLGHVASNLLPKLGMSDESQKAALVARVLGHLGLNSHRLHKDLGGLCSCSHCLWAVCLLLLQAFPVVLLGKTHVPQELGVNPLKRVLSMVL